jgi:hypothetical protein
MKNSENKELEISARRTQPNKLVLTSSKEKQFKPGDLYAMGEMQFRIIESRKARNENQWMYYADILKD